jgi:hypothetical protein
MNFRRLSWWSRPVLVAALGLAAVWPAGAGEKIRFSRPAVPIVAPAKEQAGLPEPRARQMEFSRTDFEPAMAVPPPRPPPMMRGEPRDENRDGRNRDGVHWLLTTPRMFSDPDEEKAEKARKEAAANPGRMRSSFTEDALGQARFDQPRELTPVTDLNWRPGDSPGRKKDSERNGNWEHSPFEPRRDSRLDPDRQQAASQFDFPGMGPKEKLTPAQVQRRAEFEELLNPNAGPGKVGPNSLQPVAAADAQPSALALPPASGGRIDSGISDPMKAFNEQHQRLRGPVLEDINKKYNAQPPASSSPYSSAQQTPNNRPPITREFPARKF